MFGFDYPSDGDRVTMLDEALQAFKQLQTQDTTTYEGKFVTLKDAIFEPKPVCAAGRPAAPAGRHWWQQAAHAALLSRGTPTGGTTTSATTLNIRSG